ncbi:MAG: GIY-YIG nuclease family protein [Candidatus Heimdallarchaeota archaeon]
MIDLLKEIPEKTGVYFFLDNEDRIIYIGKAVNLKRRVTDHFRKGQMKVFKKVKLKSREAPIAVTTWDLQTKHIENLPSIIYNKQRKKKTRIRKFTSKIKYIITGSEDEALTLEGCLISAFRPELNKQVWRYPFIEVTIGEEIPRVLTIYQSLLPESYIFGPFNIASDIDIAIEGFLAVIPICNSLLAITPGGKYPVSCIRHQINRCLAPCKNGDFDPQQYNKHVKEFIFELENNGEQVIKRLEEMMQKEIAVENFEGAAKFRDRINAIRKLFASKAMPSLLQKYYTEIKEIIGEKFHYNDILNNIMKNNKY